MERRFNKLVRDRIPEIIRGNGDSCVTHVADDAEYWQKLVTKLDEEIAEFKESLDPEELADVIEVIEALAAAKGMGAEALYGLKDAKARARGGFRGRIVLETTS